MRSMCCGFWIPARHAPKFIPDPLDLDLVNKTNPTSVSHFTKIFFCSSSQWPNWKIRIMREAITHNISSDSNVNACSQHSFLVRHVKEHDSGPGVRARFESGSLVSKAVPLQSPNSSSSDWRRKWRACPTRTTLARDLFFTSPSTEPRTEFY